MADKPTTADGYTSDQVAFVQELDILLLNWILIGCSEDAYAFFSSRLP